MKPRLCLALHVGERSAAGEKLHEKIVPTKDRIGNVADLLRGVENVSGNRASGRKVTCGWFGEVAECQVDTSSQSFHPRLRRQVKPELAETECRFIIAEVEAQDVAKGRVDIAGPLTIPVLQAEISHSADHETAQLFVCKQGRRHEKRENVNSRADDRIQHAGQGQQLLDGPIPKLPPQLRKFFLKVLCGGMRRPVDAKFVQAVQANLDGAMALAKGHEQIHPQAGHARHFRWRTGAACQIGESRFRISERAREKFAFSAVELESEGEIRMTFPSIR